MQAHRPAHGVCVLTALFRQEDWRVHHAARPRLGKRLRRRGAGLLGVRAHPRAPGRLPAPHRQLLPQLQLDLEHAPRHQVGGATHHGPGRSRSDAAGVLPASQRAPGPGADRSAGGRVPGGSARRLGAHAELRDPCWARSCGRRARRRGAGECRAARHLRRPRRPLRRSVGRTARPGRGVEHPGQPPAWRARAHSTRPIRSPWAPADAPTLAR